MWQGRARPINVQYITFNADMVRICLRMQCGCRCNNRIPCLPSVVLSWIYGRDEDICIAKLL